MDSEEREIFQFLKTWGAEYVSYREIARRAGGKRKFHANADWAKPLLSRMQERGILDSDAQGRYRVKPVSSKNKATRWVSPEIAKILQAKGVKVEGSNVTDIATEDYYDGL
ncbi:MAG: hypothetical protein PHY43_06990 [Verrucomicrobiales bacterium]|nr:hypothetical protein [Verrucomicrobiales bacterium]